MFGTSFELLVILVVALLVLGPERLPKVTRQVGFWVGRARAMASNLRAQFEEEVALEELKRDTERLRHDARVLHEEIGRAKATGQSGINRVVKELKRPIGTESVARRGDSGEAQPAVNAAPGSPVTAASSATEPTPPETIAGAPELGRETKSAEPRP